MKKFVGWGVLTIAAMGMLVGVFAGQKNEFKKAEGYTSSSLPTRIDLNDCTENEIRSYYSDLNSLTTAQRQGTNLLKNLKTILKNGQKYYAYDGGSLWALYEISDRDWERSPASDLPSSYNYNSTTKIINNYTYGTSNSSRGCDPYVHSLYTNRTVTNEAKAWGDHSQTGWGINQEHVWPKSQGFEASGDGGARGDPMHLMAGNGYANNAHSNLFYGYVNTSGATNCGSSYSYLNGNYKGTSKTLGSNTVFEPQDCDKGDIARAIFYMVARYNYLSGSDSDGINSNNPNLTLVQESKYYSSYTSTTSNPGKMGVLTDLLAWHHADPVDEYEIHRNNLLYKNFTNNRNPFIDFPQWVDYIWGTATYSGSTYQSYSSTPTGYATPSSDAISTSDSSTPTPYLTISNSGISLTTEETETITVSGHNFASNPTFTWSTSDSGVASLSSTSGSSVTITAVATGSATITVSTTYNNQTYSITCDVTVSDSGQGSGGDSGETAEGSVTAADGALEGWTSVGAGSAYADGSVKLDGSGDNVYKVDIFTGDVSENMTSLEVTINGKINGTPTAANSYKVEAITSSQTVLGNDTKTGSSVYTSEYNDVTFTISGDLSGCTGIKITYVTKGAGNWGIKSVSWSATYDSATPTSIFATVDKDYFVGETITKDDISLQDDLGNDITDFDFDDYTFKYEDAPSGGGDAEKEFDITYGDFETSLNVSASRKSYNAPTSDPINYPSTDFSSLSTKYSAGQTANSNGMAFTVDGYYYKNGTALSLSNGKTKAPGKVQNKNSYSTGILDVQITGASPDIQLSVDGLTWVDLASATIDSVNYYYFKAFYKTTTQTNYVNIMNIAVTLKNTETASNVSNYIMYEDTNGQCTTKFDIATSHYENMSKTERALFMTSDEYVITTARGRFTAWARNQGKTITLTNGDYVIASQNINSLFRETDNSTIIVIISLSILSTLSIGTFLLKRKKREE